MLLPSMEESSAAQVQQPQQLTYLQCSRAGRPQRMQPEVGSLQPCLLLLTIEMLGASTTASTAVRSRLAKGVKHSSGLPVLAPMAASSSISW